MIRNNIEVFENQSKLTPEKEMDIKLKVLKFISNSVIVDSYDKVGLIEETCRSVYSYIVNSNTSLPKYKEKGYELSDLVTDEYVICLEDGKKMSMLKRRLQTYYNLTLEQYRKKWDLPHDFPCVAKSHSLVRKGIAQGIDHKKRNSDK